MQKRKQNTYGLFVLMLVISSVMVVTPVGANGPPDDCHYVAYTADFDGHHFSLLKNNSILIGQTFVIETNCDIAYDIGYGWMAFSGSPSYSSDISLEQTSIKIAFVSDNGTIGHYDHYEGLTIYPAGVDGIWTSYEEYTSVKDVSVFLYDSMMVFGISELITFFVATTIISRIAVYHADREEVIVV